MTLVSVVTPTRPEREGLLIGRCIASVQALDWARVEHIIVSDQNPGLQSRLDVLPKRDGYTIRLVELNDTWNDDLSKRAQGSFPWGFGCRMAFGEYVGWLGDDDEYLPQHFVSAVSAMEESGADFSVAQVAFYARSAFVFVIGDASLAIGHLDATGVVCRRSALKVACWKVPGLNEPHAMAGDWRTVRDWQQGGLKGVFINEVTGNHHDGWLA